MEENKIPIANKWLKRIVHSSQIKELEDCMIKFAKLHVQEALKQAYDKVEIGKDLDIDSDTYGMIGIKKDSILNAYPLENIK